MRTKGHVLLESRNGFDLNFIRYQCLHGSLGWSRSSGCNFGGFALMGGKAQISMHHKLLMIKTWLRHHLMIIGCHCNCHCSLVCTAINCWSNLAFRLLMCFFYWVFLNIDNVWWYYTAIMTMTHWPQCTLIFHACLTFYATHQQFTFDSTNGWIVCITIKWNREVIICERYEVATAALEFSLSCFVDHRETNFWVCPAHTFSEWILATSLLTLWWVRRAVQFPSFYVQSHVFLTSRQWVIDHHWLFGCGECITACLAMAPGRVRWYTCI